MSICYRCSKALKPFRRISEPPQEIVLVTQLEKELMHERQKREKMGNVLPPGSEMNSCKGSSV